MKAYCPTTASKMRIDFKTSNTSFLKMTAIFLKMGIKNAFFHLRLDDKKLSGVDPYDKDLDKEDKLRIFRECKNNRWYFYREVFRVTEGGTATGVGGGTQFIASRGNLAYLWANSLNINTYLIMPRQTGKTWAAIADCTWVHQFNRGSSILHFNKSQRDSADNLNRIKAAIRMLPLWMQHSADTNTTASEKRLVKNNDKFIRNSIDATIDAMASAGNEAKADALARGKTASKIWYDEIAFIFFNEVIYSAATPAYEKAMESAIKNHAPYGISITTTPGDLATPHGAFAYKMMQDSIRFNETLYDMSGKELFDIIEHTPDKIPYLFIQYSYLQLGETEDWYLTRFKKMNNPLKARREYLLEWINSNGNSPFDPDDLEHIGQLAKFAEMNRKTVRLNKYFEMNIYDEYNGRKPVLIGVDVAGSMGRDSSAIVVVNPESLRPIAVFKSNMIDLKALQKLISTIIKKLYPYCVLTIENNSVGEGVIRNLLDTPVGRLIYRERKKKTQDMGVNAVSKKRKYDGIMYGHNTNTHTRPQMMEMLESIVHNNPAHMAIPEIYEELKFLELKNGRIDHSASTHDDVVMAYLGALWIVKYGTGLKGKGIYYNIEDGTDGYDELQYDTVAAMRNANRILKRAKKHNDDDIDFETAEQELVDFMTKEHHVQTSKDWYQRERDEYFDAVGRIDGISDDDEKPLSISENTQRLITASYNAMLTSDLYRDDDDPISNLLRPRIERNTAYENLVDAYKW